MSKEPDKNENVIIALFDNEDFANYGINLLEQWDREDTTVKLGAIGVISSKDGKVKTRAPRRAGGGAKLGVILGGIAAVLTGGTSILVGAMGGALLGGAAGALAKKSLHLSKEEIQALGQELDKGRVAVVVTCDEYEVEPTSQKLIQYGGDVKGYEVPEAALAQAAAIEGTTLTDEAEEPAAAADEATSDDDNHPVAAATALAAGAAALDNATSDEEQTPADDATSEDDNHPVAGAAALAAGAAALDDATSDDEQTPADDAAALAVGATAADETTSDDEQTPAASIAASAAAIAASAAAIAASAAAITAALNPAPSDDEQTAVNSTLAPTTTENIVPVDYAIIGFTGNKLNGEIATEISRLVNAGLIRIIDALIISKDVDGQFTSFELNALPEDEYNQFVPIAEHLEPMFTPEDVETAAADVPPNCSALLLIWQNIWTEQFRRAVANANGMLLAQDRIPAEVWNQVQAEIQSKQAESTTQPDA